MPIYSYDYKQQDRQWFDARAGIPTASCFDKIVTPAKCELSKQADGYMAGLVAEWALGRSFEEEKPQTAHMVRGIEEEDSAVKAFEFEYEVETKFCAFITTDDGMIGGSPDRLIGDARGLEIKTHMPWIQAEKMEEQRLGRDVLSPSHKCQVQGLLWISERERWDIVSYHKQMPLVVTPVLRDERYIASLSAAVRQFVDKMLEMRMAWASKWGAPFVKPKAKEDWGKEYHVTEADLDRTMRETFGQDLR